MKKAIDFLRSMRFGMILLALVMLLGFAGSMIVQQREPMEYVNRYGEDAARLILATGLDDVFSAPYFIAVLAALSVNLLLCSIVRFPKVRGAADRLIKQAETCGMKESIGSEDAKKLGDFLKTRGYKAKNADGRTVYTKHTAGFYGSFLTHLSFLLILAVGGAAVLTADVQDRVVMPGETLTLEDGTAITVHSFAIEDETGRLDFTSDIEMTAANGQTKRAEIRVNEPMALGGYKVYQQTYGTAGAVRINNLKNGASEDMILSEPCMLTLDGVSGMFYNNVYPGYVKAEDGSITLITSSSGAYDDPVYDVMSVAEGDMTAVLAFPGETLTIGDVGFTMLDPVSYPGLRIKATSRVLLGALYAVFVLMVAALYLCFFMAPVAVAVSESGYAVVSPKTQTGLMLDIAALLEKKPDEGGN